MGGMGSTGRRQWGLILSIDGIQPDKGNETVYLVREVLTERILAAENVSSSRTEVIKHLLAPVVTLGLPVRGVVSDAQESILLAVAALWPEVPHQVCQFHSQNLGAPRPGDPCAS